MAAGIVYAVVAGLSASGVVDGLLFPNLVWAGIVFWLGPALAAVSLGVTVIVSARVETVQEAFQIAGIIVVPIVALVVVQAAGLLALAPVLLFAGWAVGWAIAAVVLASVSKPSVVPASVSAFSRLTIGAVHGREQMATVATPVLSCFESDEFA